MNPERLERLTAKIGAQMSRRTVLASAVGAGGLTLVEAPAVLAQDGSPIATPVDASSTGVEFMFVQTLGAGSIDAATDGVESLLLVADHLAGQTLFFSDRPQRIVGMVPTADFLTGGKDSAGLGFTPADPPNAALVLPNGRILVVELFDPQYDTATGEVRYQMNVLEDVTQIDLQLQSEPLVREDVVGEFTAASLFIDDCPDGHVVCWNPDNEPIGSIPASGSIGFCWDSDDLCCLPCESPPSGDTWDAGCNAVFGDQCGDGCGYSFAAAFSCAQ